MANEITVTGSLSINNGNLRAIHQGTFQSDQSTGIGGNPGSVTLSTTYETISLSDLTAPGWCFAKNLDSTYSVQIGSEVSGPTFCPMIQLAPGEFAIFPLASSITLAAKATSGTPTVLLHIYDA